MRFKKQRGGLVRADPDPVEVDVLVAVTGDLLVLLGEQDDADADPLAAIVGLSQGPVDKPDDPALARLLPDAYGDDAAAATEFRRFTEADLRASGPTRAPSSPRSLRSSTEVVGWCSTGTRPMPGSAASTICGWCSAPGSR
jgi:hypothetical protein